MLSINRGDTPLIHAIVSQNKSIFDLTGYSAKFYIKALSTADLIVEKDGVIVNPTSGEITFKLTKVDTDRTEAVYDYEIKILDPDTLDYYTIVQDNIAIKKVLKIF